MQKLLWIFLFLALGFDGLSQCNISVLIPLSDEYKITNGDTVGQYARVNLDSSNSFRVKIEMDSVDKNLKIPFILLHPSDTPLIITKMYWGEPFFAPRYIPKPILKNDTSFAADYTLLYPSYSLSRFNKTSIVITNKCTFYFMFKGSLATRKEKEE